MGGNGGMLQPIITWFVTAFVMGTVEIAVLWFAYKALFGRHEMMGVIGAIIAVLILTQYQSVAGLVAQGIGGLGIG